MIFCGRIVDIKKECCSLCSFKEESFCRHHELNLDKIDYCVSWMVFNNWNNIAQCRECSHSFRDMDLLKCEMRELDSDWCVMVIKKCPIGKWRME